MLELKRTGARNQDFEVLVKELQEELSLLYTDYNEKFAGHYYLDEKTFVVLAYVDNDLAGGAALRPIDQPDKLELKRMFVRNAFRRTGISKAILQELENWAKETGRLTIQLETGLNQPEAILLYEKNGYSHYKPDAETWPESVFMKKLLI